MGPHYSSAYTQTGKLTTYSYTRSNGLGAVESRITCKNEIEGVYVTSLNTFSDGLGRAFTQEWGPHVGDCPGAGDNTCDTTAPKDGFNVGDYSHLPMGWSEAVILTGAQKPVGGGLEGAKGNGNFAKTFELYPPVPKVPQVRL